MAGTVVADTLRADSTSTLVLRNGVANTPPTVQDSAGTEIGTFCRAWVNFDGSAASPITPRGSFNISSVTKSGTSQFTISFTTAMPDANFNVVASGGINGSTASNSVLISANAINSSSCFICTRNGTNADAAYTSTSVSIFR